MLGQISTALIVAAAVFPSFANGAGSPYLAASAAFSDANDAAAGAAPTGPQAVPRPPAPGRAWLGVSVADVTPRIAADLGVSAGRGAAIVDIAERSPAEKAGLQLGDVVLEADQHTVQDFRALAQIIQQKSPGELIHLRVWRKGQRVNVEARLVQRPQEAAAAPVVDDARRARFVQCNRQICPLCEDPANPMAGSSDACLDCIRANSQQIEQCITGAAPPGSGGVAEQPGGSQATPAAPPPLLTLNRIEVKPARVAAGERFTITVSYTAATGGVPVFRYAIRSGEQNLFESKSQNLEAGSGEPMFISKTLTAANKPGAYTIRVTLTLDEVRIEREAELTVTRR